MREAEAFRVLETLARRKAATRRFRAAAAVAHDKANRKVTSVGRLKWLTTGRTSWTRRSRRGERPACRLYRHALPQRLLGHAPLPGPYRGGAGGLQRRHARPAVQGSLLFGDAGHRAAVGPLRPSERDDDLRRAAERHFGRAQPLCGRPRSRKLGARLVWMPTFSRPTTSATTRRATCSSPAIRCGPPRC